MLRASWVMARAFTANAVLAVAAMPFVVLTIACYALRRAVYLDPTRTGVVIIARHKPWLDGLIAAALAIPAFTLLGLVNGYAAAADDGGHWLTWLTQGVIALFFLSFLVMMLSSPGSFVSTVGPETPRTNLHALMGLSQLPGTRLTALPLARSVVGALPADSTVAVAAATDELARAYERLGFVAGPKRRLHLIVGGGTSSSA